MPTRGRSARSSGPAIGRARLLMGTIPVGRTPSQEESRQSLARPTVLARRRQRRPRPRTAHGYVQALSRSTTRSPASRCRQTSGSIRNPWRFVFP